MATYQPPTEDLTDFNSSVFKTANESTLTLSDAQALFLGRTGTPTSVATTTTFSSGDLMIQGATFGLGGGGTINNGNVACGDSALLSNSTGNKNTAVGGYAALGGNLTGSSNTAVGDRCLQNSDANNNVGVGASCLSANNTGFNNTAVGTTALAANTTGSRNVAIGFEAFKTGTIYNNSIALGANTVVAGNQAVAIGYLASASDSQIVLGTTAETVLCKGTTGNGSLIASADIFVNGVRAGVGKFQTDTNTCFGKDSLITTTSLGINNAAFGNSALKLQAGGANCSAFGSGALATTTAEGNTGVGALAGNAISSGIKNTAVGSACLKFVNTGNRNTGVGNATGQLLTTGTENTLLGYLTGGNLTGGSQNTFVGSTVTSAASVTSSSALGAFSGVGAFSNSTAIGGGTSAVIPGAVCTAANQIMLGRASETVYCPGTTTNGSLIASADIFVNGVRAGVGSFQSDTNTCFGNGALEATNTGTSNTAIGKDALMALTSGNFNTSVGVSANQNNVSGSYNTVVGVYNGGKLGSESTDYKVLMGYNNFGRSNSILIGNNLDSAASTIIIGNSSGTNGGNSIIIGNNIVISQSKSISIGEASAASGLRAICLGADSTASGTDSTVIGYGATTSVSNQIVLGRSSETVYCPGTSANGSLIASADIFVNGVRAGVGKFQSDTNTCFGSDALFTTSTSINNSAFGRNALKLCSGTATTSGYSNNAFGAFSLQALTTGFRNVGVGTYSLGASSVPLNTGNRNTGCGYAAGFIFSTGASDNTYIGCHRDNSAYTTGSTNTLIGSQSILGPGNNILLTVNASTSLGAFTSVGGFSNSTAIGGGTSTAIPGAVCSAANQIMLGRTTETVYCPGVPTTGSTTYTSLVLSGGLQLQTAYSVAPSATMLGYKVITTGTAVILTSTTISNLVDVAVPIGVWNVSFSVSVTVTAGGNVTAQNIVFSETTASTTALSTICGQSKKHSSETYATDDVYIVSNSFEYQTTSATNIYLNMVCTFSGGAGLTATGYVSLTRIG